MGRNDLQKLALSGLHAYSHHMRFKLAAQMGQSVRNTPSSWAKLVTKQYKQTIVTHLLSYGKRKKHNGMECGTYP